MKTSGKTFLFLFLSAILLTSCGLPATTMTATQPGMPPATANAPSEVGPAALLTLTAGLTATDAPVSTRTPRPAATATPTYTPLPALLPNAIDLQWITAYGLPGDQYATKIRPAHDGGFALVGNTVRGDGYNAWLLKLRADGLIVWQKSLPQVKALDVLETSDGDFILAGERDWIKLGSQGNLLWQYTFGGPSYHTGPILRLVEESNGNIVVEAEGSHAVFNAEGELQSFVEYAAPSESQTELRNATDRLVTEPLSYVVFVEATADGGAIVGVSVFEDLGLVASWSSHLQISRLTGDGAVRWQRQYGFYFGASYGGVPVLETKSGDFIVAGNVNYYADTGDRNHVWMFRLDREGKIQWEKVYATGKHEQAGWEPEEQEAVNDIQELSNGDLVFAGQTSGAGTRGHDMWVLKTNARGEIPNCGLMFDGSTGQAGDAPPEVVATPLVVEPRLRGASLQAIPLCSPSP